MFTCCSIIFDICLELSSRSASATLAKMLRVNTYEFAPALRNSYGVLSLNIVVLVSFFRFELPVEPHLSSCSKVSFKLPE